MKKYVKNKIQSGLDRLFLETFDSKLELTGSTYYESLDKELFYISFHEGADYIYASVSTVLECGRYESIKDIYNVFQKYGFKIKR